MFEINSRWTIDGSSRRNVARYVNHSCRPNVEAIERRGGVIVYVARRRIKPDEEITVDYGRDYFDPSSPGRAASATNAASAAPSGRASTAPGSGAP